MMDLRRFLLPALLILLFVTPVLAETEPGLLWTNDMTGSVTDIDFDTLLNNIIVSDDNGDIKCFSFDGNTTKWTKNVGAVYVDKLHISTSGAKIGYKTTATDGDMTYLDGTLGTVLWTPSYTAGWGSATDIAMTGDATKLLTTFANKAKLYDSSGNDIGNITPPTGTWNKGIISKDTGSYMVMSRASNATLYLYKYGYGTTWSDSEHNIIGYSSYDYRRVLTLTGVTASGTNVSFAITTNSGSESSPSVLYLHGYTTVQLCDSSLNAISSTRVYNAVTGYYDIYFDPDGETEIWVLYG